MNNNQSQVNSTDFGIPHNRPRVYFAGIRRSELLAHFAKTKDEVLAAFMNKKLGRTHLDPKNFRTFLEECGLPIEANSLKVDDVQSMKSVQSDADCSCGVRSLCTLHTCKCSICKREGHKAMKCIWRRGQTKSMHSLPFLGLPSKMSRELPWERGGREWQACLPARTSKSCLGTLAVLLAR